MQSRRRFLQLSFAALLASAARAVLSNAELPEVPPAPDSTLVPTSAATALPRAPRHVRLPLVLSRAAPTTVPFVPAVAPAPQPVYLPLVQTSTPQIGAPLVGPASGSAAQAIAWLAARDIYGTDITRIVNTYQRIGEQVGLDWFLAIAQMAHETGSLTSWWSQPPRRNLAGIGVTGAWQAGLPDGSPGPAPGPAWAWSAPLGRWLAGVSFPTWGSDAVPAHLGRLLAYALPAGLGDLTQQSLIAQAVGYRSLSASHYGSAPTIVGLNGRWAVPGTEYGQRIMALAEAMRRL
jgi:Mannosyl-glycoprotein endo-beta-N-acetylglucosaminidase